MDIDRPWYSMDNTAGARRSVQNNLIWIAPRGSNNTAVAATSGQSMDVDIAVNSQVSVDTGRVYVKPPPKQISEARSYIQPAQGNFINKDSGRQLSLAAQSHGHTSTTNQSSDAKLHIKPAAGTFRKEDSAMQWSRGQVTSTSFLGSGMGSKSYIRPAQGNFMNTGSPRPDTSLCKQLSNPIFNPGFNPGGVLGNKERSWYSMDITACATRPDTSLVKQLPNPLFNPGYNPGGVWGNNKAMIGMDMEWVPYDCKATGTPGSLVPGMQPSHTSVTKATTQVMDMEWGPYSRKTSGTPGFPPSGCSTASPGSLVPAVHPHPTSVTKATAQTPSTKRPLEEILSKAKRSGSAPAAQRRRTDHGPLVSAVQCDRTPIALATSRTPSTKRPLTDIMSEDERLGSEPAAKRMRGHGSPLPAATLDFRA